MFLSLLYFSLSNYILGIIICSVFGFAVGNIYSDTDAAKFQAKSLTTKLYLLIILCITLIRIKMMSFGPSESANYMISGTVCTLLFREGIGNMFHAYVIHGMKKTLK